MDNFSYSRKYSLFKRMGKKLEIDQVHSSRSFHHIIDLERARVNREGYEFSLILFRITDKAKSEKILSRIGRTISKRIRKIDQMGLYDKNHLGLLLPYTPLKGARKIARELCSNQDIGMHIMDCDFYAYPEISKTR